MTTNEKDQQYFFDGISMSYDTAVANGYIDPDAKIIMFGGLTEPVDFTYDNPKDPDAIVRGRQNQRLGEITEGFVKNHLEKLGFRMIRKVQNIWKIVKFVEKGKDGKVLAWVVPVKIEGDYRCVDSATGKSVLVEVKARQGKLIHSSLEHHQIEELTEHGSAGGISLLAWVDTAVPEWKFYIMRWPVEDEDFIFVKRTSITPEIALRFDIQDRE